MPQTVLIVDDDPVQRRLLEAAITRSGMSVVTAPGGQPALDLLNGPRGEQFSLILLDLVMPDIDGLAVMAKVRPTHPDLPIIVLTAKGGIDSAVEAMRAGANDFLVKPASPERIAVSIRNALKIGVLSGEVRQLKKKTENRLSFDDMVAKSAEMRQVFRLGQRAAQSTIPILIEGESGVGKELVARAIQGSSDRAGRPFVTVNCGAIPENLIESILFGHEKGSFTGASDKHLGKFQEADGGTLFLDEIGELRLDMQVKLLRALQEGEVDAVGSKRPVKVDVRIVSATNRDLAEQVKAGAFREDLYYRLNVFPIHVPPLRDRHEDIPALARFFVSRFAAEENKPVAGMTPEAADLLERYSWPGNVRQLENVLLNAWVMSEDLELDAPDFDIPDGWVSDEASATRVPREREPSAPRGATIKLRKGGVSEHRREERDRIMEALRESNWNRVKAAEISGIPRRTFYRRLREYGIQ
ncbi:MAG TPA: sigma-54 dependent transcriptional regulator [Polyangiaceae bacterium]|nr:sigma-54 dependent transcriptional regulator [Polyangiaceae bacterium]